MKNVLIIAEAGVNHNGSVGQAKKLIDVAAEAGADFVKFQTFKAENLVNKTVKKASYQIKNMGDSTGEETQFMMLKKYELDIKTHQNLIEYCKKKHIGFLSTAFDLESIDLLNNLGMRIFKISSGDLTNLTYLKKVGVLRKKVLLSTGMATLEEIREALKILIDAGTSRKNITVMHCNTDYPTKMEDVNLRAMITIQKKFDIEIGYSDHTLGIEVPIAAVAMGAKVIEKHFTLDRKLPGPDHKASLEPQELKAMVIALRNIETALGTAIKRPSKSEFPNRVVARKSIHLAKDLKKGTTIAEDDLIMLRPGDGISPMKLDRVIGKKINRNLKKGVMLKLEDFNN